MIRRLNMEQETDLRIQFRQLYKDLGPSSCLQVIYELVRSAEILADIMVEEGEHEKT